MNAACGAHDKRPSSIWLPIPHLVNRRAPNVSRTWMHQACALAGPEQVYTPVVKQGFIS
jgi:hypothetical protein